MHSVTDRQTDGQTDGQQDDANSRSYCVAVRSAKKYSTPESSADVIEFGTALVNGRKDFLEFTTLYNGGKFQCRFYMQGWKNLGF